MKNQNEITFSHPLLTRALVIFPMSEGEWVSDDGCRIVTENHQSKVYIRSTSDPAAAMLLHRIALGTLAIVGDGLLADTDPMVPFVEYFRQESAKMIEREVDSYPVRLPDAWQRVNERTIQVLREVSHKQDFIDSLHQQHRVVRLHSGRRALISQTEGLVPSYVINTVDDYREVISDLTVQCMAYCTTSHDSCILQALNELNAECLRLQTKSHEEDTLSTGMDWVTSLTDPKRIAAVEAALVEVKKNSKPYLIRNILRSGVYAHDEAGITQVLQAQDVETLETLLERIKNLQNPTTWQFALTLSMKPGGDCDTLPSMRIG